MHGLIKEVSFDIKKSDGSTFPALINGIGVNDDEGILLAINATVYDITERKRYEGELLRSKKEGDIERADFELLSDFIPEMIWMANNTGKISYVNKPFSRLFQNIKSSIIRKFNLRKSSFGRY
jgi:PAS domain-containing protein